MKAIREIFACRDERVRASVAQEARGTSSHRAYRDRCSDSDLIQTERGVLLLLAIREHMNLNTPGHTKLEARDRGARQGCDGPAICPKKGEQWTNEKTGTARNPTS